MKPSLMDGRPWFPTEYENHLKGILLLESCLLACRMTIKIQRNDMLMSMKSPYTAAQRSYVTYIFVLPFMAIGYKRL